VKRTGAASRGAWGRPLPRSAYAGNCERVARSLLGRVLVCGRGRSRVAGRIVEVEAYRGHGDPASHAFRGRTPRNAVMFGPPGHSYVYFTYGMHFCLNLVTESEGSASAVLLRALEPLEGLDLMRRRRAHRGRSPADAALARGPGNLARALGIGRRDSGLDLTRGMLWVSSLAPRRGGRRILALPRIGIRRATSRRWRFVLEGHPCASPPRRARAVRARPLGRASRLEIGVDRRMTRP
jgi:DNA-3-methyladenine glycosylase